MLISLAGEGPTNEEGKSEGKHTEVIDMRLTGEKRGKHNRAMCARSGRSRRGRAVGLGARSPAAQAPGSGERLEEGKGGTPTGGVSASYVVYAYGCFVDRRHREIFTGENQWGSRWRRRGDAIKRVMLQGVRPRRPLAACSSRQQALRRTACGAGIGERGSQKEPQALRGCVYDSGN